MQTLSALPDRFPAGTTVQYSRTYADVPTGAGHSIRLFIAGVSVAARAGGASGEAWEFELTAADTARMKAGTHVWVERATLASGKVYDLASGSVIVTPDVAAARAGELQSWEERTLAVVEAALEGRLTSDIESYQIAGRAVNKIPIEQLLRLRGELKAAVRAQKNKGQTGRVHRVRFGR